MVSADEERQAAEDPQVEQELRLSVFTFARPLTAELPLQTRLASSNLKARIGVPGTKAFARFVFVMRIVESTEEYI